MSPERSQDPSGLRHPEPATGAAPGVRSSPFCSRLKSKKSYFLRGPALEEADLIDGSAHCWCARTMQALGPDGEAATPADCRSGRTCFEPIL